VQVVWKKAGRSALFGTGFTTVMVVLKDYNDRLRALGVFTTLWGGFEIQVSALPRWLKVHHPGGWF
jgi:hypothetical protein